MGDINVIPGLAAVTFLALIGLVVVLLNDHAIRKEKRQKQHKSC